MATRHLAKLGAMLRSVRKAGFEERRFDTGEVELNYAIGWKFPAHPEPTLDIDFPIVFRH